MVFGLEDCSDSKYWSFKISCGKFPQKNFQLSKEMKQDYLIRFVNCNTKDSSDLQLNNTETSIKGIKVWMQQQETSSLLIKHHFHIIGDKSCDMEIEDLYHLCRKIQTLISSPLSWDIIEKPLNEEDRNLIGYFLLY